MKIQRIHLALLAFMIGMTTAQAQFNIKVGYNIGYAQTPNIDAMFKAFDTKTPLDNTLSRVGLLHGFDLGVRYRWYDISFELGTTRLSSKSKALGTLDGEKIENKWTTSVNNYHLGVSQHIKNFSFGGEISRQNFKMKNFNTVSETDTEITSQKDWALKVFLQFETSSEMNSIAIRPFYQFSLGDYDISDIPNQLDVNYTGATNEKIGIFGLSIIIFNGPQHD